MCGRSRMFGEQVKVKSRARRVRPEYCMARQDVALVSVKLSKLVPKKYGNTTA